MIYCSLRFVRDSLLIRKTAESSKPVWPILGEIVDGRVTPIREDGNAAKLSEENDRMTKTSGPVLRLRDTIVEMGDPRVVPGRVIQTLSCISPVLFQVLATLRIVPFQLR